MIANRAERPVESKSTEGPGRMRTHKQSTYERLSGGNLNRKQRKQLIRQLQSEDPGLEVVHGHVAGIDIGNESHYVAVGAECDPEPVQEFGSWTADLRRMGDWLAGCGIRHVVMQATGVYWIAVHDVLEKRGMQVLVTNARDTKNLPGRKSDVQESQWLRKLHTYGLLRNSFRPPEQIREIRTIWRLRDRHVGEAGRAIQHMQKALTKMNVQLANTISDISGVTGQAIIRAIVDGERDPWELARMRDFRIHASEEEIARSLEGNWQPDVLLELRQAVECYDFYHRQIAECDRHLQSYLAELPSREVAKEEEGTKAEPEGEGGGGARKRKKKRRGSKPRKNEPGFDLRGELKRICGVDLGTIDGVDVMTIQTFVAELGTDMTRWPSENHLVSWLQLAPRRQVSGGKVIRHERVKGRNRASEALRMAASTLRHSDSYLGSKFRHMQGRLGPGKAVKAMAAYLARLFYRMLTRGEEWVDRGAEEQQKRREEREMAALKRKAAALGYRLEAAA